jgi:hypothetical protein
MAQRLLESVIHQGLTKHHVHAPYHYRHDLESFVYVLVYAVVKKVHRLLVAQDNANAQIAQELRKAHLSDSTASDDSTGEDDVPRGPDGEPLSTPLERVTELLSSMFGHSSFETISQARSHLRNSWTSFMRATKGRGNPDYVNHPSRLHWVIVSFLNEVVRQNAAPPSQRLVGATKHIRMNKDQAHWLNGEDLLDFLESELKWQEAGIAPWGDTEGEDEVKTEGEV